MAHNNQGEEEEDTKNEARLLQKFSCRDIYQSAISIGSGVKRRAGMETIKILHILILKKS